MNRLSKNPKMPSTNVDCLDLVDRSNHLIEKHSLPVPRFLSSRFINYHFWAIVFNKIFKIKCNISVRTLPEQVQMIRSCLNTLETLIEVPLDHIKPVDLLNYQPNAIRNLLQISEVWSENFATSTDQSDSNNNNSDHDSVDNCVQEEQRYSIKSDPGVISRRSNDVDLFNSKSAELAHTLYKALKNQIVAIEIEKKIKLYLGDVSIRDDTKLRASRQSIVRTRAIQPVSAFEYHFHTSRKHNPILSVDLERCYPDLSKDIIDSIRVLERSLLLLERNVRSCHNDQSMNRISRLLGDAVEEQRARIEMMRQEIQNKKNTTTMKSKRFFSLNLARETRSQRALLHSEITQFYKESTAAFLNARSCLEHILLTEFRKLNSHQRETINEMRKYLRNHHEEEIEKVRLLLQSIDRLYVI